MLHPAISIVPIISHLGSKSFQSRSHISRGVLPQHFLASWLRVMALEEWRRCIHPSRESLEPTPFRSILPNALAFDINGPSSRISQLCSSYQRFPTWLNRLQSPHLIESTYIEAHYNGLPKRLNVA